MCILHLCIHSSVDEHLGCFHPLVVADNAAVNMGAQTSVCVPVFHSLRYIPWNALLCRFTIGNVPLRERLIVILLPPPSSQSGGGRGSCWGGKRSRVYMDVLGFMSLLFSPLVGQAAGGAFPLMPLKGAHCYSPQGNPGNSGLNVDLCHLPPKWL